MSEPTAKRKPRKATQRSLENAALFYLQRFASSSENLRRVLMRRVERSARTHETDSDEGAAWVDDIVRRYLASGLLDDGAYAEARAQSLRRRGDSAYKIRGKLMAKGVGADLIAETLEAEDKGVELEAAAALARRRGLGPFRAGNRKESRQRDMAALARAGFSPDVAQRVVEAETPDDLAQAVEAERDDW